ncbi:pheST operon leader peptide PheM [Serratia symbiotica]|uniref:PheST operon leader peptide PheM n=1 Tax=Serratia symbiotica TaxID=138074 RepID=A0A7D5NQT0_9GAMM|nr:pheST operon leader peptide PheM [Serratia symbiotica]MBQ0956526.1 pheST operon leader peptide PheM [Serratia symbiotica]QLH64306.1 pheST operon leader peptide PheM [Serratia symbiotica]QTP15870.1 pheST operon leader peptide PheM [Serratia symbiotica]
MYVAIFRCFFCFSV